MRGLQNSVDAAVKTILYQAAFVKKRKEKKKSGLISVNVQNWLDCDQVKQSRLQTVRKNSPETSLKVCCRYW